MNNPLVDRSVGATVAFVGLGMMGAPMARNLLAAGFDVIAWNRSAPAREAFMAAGGRVASNAAEAAAGADIAITMLPDSPDVKEVALGSAGVIANLPAGAVYIDMSTIDPETARELARAGEAAGVRVLDAPVSGGVSGAQAGKLSIMVGGLDEDVASVTGVLDVLGSTVVHVGPHGAGQIVKAANQLVVAGNLALVAEAIVFVERLGLEVDKVLAVLSGGLAGSAVLQRKGPAMSARDFQPSFRAELHHKDLGIAQRAAREADAVLPVTALAGQYIAALVAKGHGGEDHGAVIRIVEALSASAPS